MSSMAPAFEIYAVGLRCLAEMLPISESAILRHLNSKAGRKGSIFASISRLNEQQRAFVLDHVKQRQGNLVHVERGPTKANTTVFGRVKSTSLFWILDRPDTQEYISTAPELPLPDGTFRIYVQTRTWFPLVLIRIASNY